MVRGWVWNEMKVPREQWREGREGEGEDRTGQGRTPCGVEVGAPAAASGVNVVSADFIGLRRYTIGQSVSFSHADLG